MILESSIGKRSSTPELPQSLKIIVDVDVAVVLIVVVVGVEVIVEVLDVLSDSERNYDRLTILSHFCVIDRRQFFLCRFGAWGNQSSVFPRLSSRAYRFFSSHQYIARRHSVCVLRNKNIRSQLHLFYSRYEYYEKYFHRTNDTPDYTGIYLYDFMLLLKTGIRSIFCDFFKRTSFIKGAWLLWKF